MTEFPSLDESDFIKTRRKIHSIAKVIGKFREALVKPIAKNDNLWLKAGEKGFDSSIKYDISEQSAKDFLVQFANYNELLTDLHKKLNIGVKTQICLWPHHFDNAFKWFSGKKINEEDEYMGIGVSNGDEMY